MMMSQIGFSRKDCSEVVEVGMQIFLSYGHDEYASFAKRLKHDLEEEGFTVFMDCDQICASMDWEIKLEKGIEVSDWIVLIMTEYSVRRPDGYCLNEVAYARNVGKQIVPVMVQRVNPPLSIARIQYIDMENFFAPCNNCLNEEAYEKRKTELIEILKGIRNLSYEGIKGTLSYYLKPIDNDVYSNRFRNNFYGRDELFKICKEWINDPEKQILWIYGDAGSGKTAFIAELTQREKDIDAVHFCRYNDNERSDPKRALMSLAYYLSTQLPEYRDLLENLHDADSLIEKNTTRLFEYLFVEQFSKIPDNGQHVVIVIDALDEATTSTGKNELLDVLACDFKRLPSWVKLIVTSRNIPRIRQRFAKEQSVDLTGDKWGDIDGFIRMSLKNELEQRTDAEAIVKKLREKSAGNFLYARLIVDDIKDGVINLENVDDFPVGLNGIYCNYFDRILSLHPEIDFKQNIRPILNLLCTTCMPLDMETLCEISGMDEDDFDEGTDAIRELFPQRNNTIEPIHKSIFDWLSDKEKSCGYHVNINKGNTQFAEYFYKLYEKGKYKGNSSNEKYTLRYLCKHLINSRKYAEARDILMDAAYQQERITQMGLDSAVRLYLNELKELYRNDDECALEVLRGETFIDLFTSKRKFFYNSGLFFDVKECGFDTAIEGDIYDSFSTETKIGIINYRYITESFIKCIELIKSILTGSLSVEHQSELYNILALCYRKNVDFTESEECFKKAFELGAEQETFYDQSISLINLGKISYHRLDWDESYKWTEMGIEYLQKELDRAEEQHNSDYIITLKLFLAEYHRLYAESLIWASEKERAEKELEFAKNMYELLNTRDRYYIRFYYTSTFCRLLSKSFDEVSQECDLIFEHTTSNYDKSQVLFYKGIALAGLNNTPKLKKCVEAAREYAQKIGAWLEFEEITYLGNRVFGEGSYPHCSAYMNNTHIRKWIPYVAHFLDKILSEQRNYNA
jgi:tetratricopeptide (TPR) repeat protein